MAGEWRVLGAGSILPREHYGCSGYALRAGTDTAWTLFDCGPGTIRALAPAGIALGVIERVVVSHFHPDHCWDLFALAFARRNPALKPVTKLEIVGPRGIADLLERGASIYGERTWLRFERTTVREVEPAARGKTLDCGAFELAWTATRHTPEAVAWRADLASGGSVTYTGDSGENADVAALAHETDLFVVECSFPDDHEVEHHLTPSSAGRMARDAACRKLVLTHFYPVLDPEVARAGAARWYAGPIEVARDQSLHAIGG